MLLDRGQKGDDSQRLERLERVVSQQGYALCGMMVVTVVNIVITTMIYADDGPPDYDHIAVSLTMFQALFGIAAVYGFWALRGLTREKAEEVAKVVTKEITTPIANASATAAETAAKEVAERIAEKEIRELAPPLILREIEAYLQTKGLEPTISDSEVERMLDAFGDEEGERGE